MSLSQLQTHAIFLRDKAMLRWNIDKIPLPQPKFKDSNLNFQTQKCIDVTIFIYRLYIHIHKEGNLQNIRRYQRGEPLLKSKKDWNLSRRYPKLLIPRGSVKFHFNKKIETRWSNRANCNSNLRPELATSNTRHTDGSLTAGSAGAKVIDPRKTYFSPMGNISPTLF